MNQISWILFDLGGVVLEVNQSRIFAELARLTGRREEDLRNVLLGDVDFWHRFVVAEFTPAQVSTKVNELLGTGFSEDQVVAAVNAELGTVIESTARAIPVLRQRTRVGCLSNTNSIHWDHMLRSYDFMRHFDRRFASQMLGSAKPSPAIYHGVVEHLGVRPQEILFFDDKHENVETAQQLGWNARIYSSHEGLRQDLASFMFDLDS